ncbi:MULTISPECIES: hypothetical protein [unclassified Frankia]
MSGTVLPQPQDDSLVEQRYSAAFRRSSRVRAEADPTADAQLGGERQSVTRGGYPRPGEVHLDLNAVQATTGTHLSFRGNYRE